MIYEFDVQLFTRPANRHASQTRTITIEADSRSAAVEAFWSVVRANALSFAVPSVSPPHQSKTQEKTMSNEIPRRSRIDLFTPAEKAIYDAVAAVEAAGCDVRLTHAVNKLSEARALVADFIDGVPFGEGYPRPVAGASTVGAPSLEMLAKMTPEERSRMVASAAPAYASSAGGTTTTPRLPENDRG